MDEFAWAVGLFEGEGCIYVGTSRSKYSASKVVHLKLGSTDKDVVDRFHKAVAVGRLYEIRKFALDSSRKDLHTWECRVRTDSIALLEKMLPYLGNRRREKALEALRVHINNPLRLRGRKKITDPLS
jgi:hypothetical protein